MSNFQTWWDSEGSAMRPQENEDLEEFAKRVTEIAWSNGEFCAIEVRKAFDRATALAEQPAQQEPLMVDIHPPATQRDRWMYEQGRLAERDPRSHTPQAQPAQQGPIYQCQDSNGKWTDQAKHSYDYNVKHGSAVVRVVYTTPQAQPPYKDSTPNLSVGDSAFESWFSEYHITNDMIRPKQVARDAYAAGMGDPLVAPAAQPAREPVMYVDPEAIRLLLDPTYPGVVTAQLTRHKPDPIRGPKVGLSITKGGAA